MAVLRGAPRIPACKAVVRRWSPGGLQPPAGRQSEKMSKSDDRSPPACATLSSRSRLKESSQDLVLIQVTTPGASVAPAWLMALR